MTRLDRRSPRRFDADAFEALEGRILLSAAAAAGARGPCEATVVVPPASAAASASETLADEGAWDLSAALGTVKLPDGGLHSGGKKGKVQVLVKNQGPSRLPKGQAVDVKLFARPSGVEDDTRDVLVGELTHKIVSKLGVDKVKKAKVKIAAPSSLPGGHYLLVGVVDADNDLPETDETNNATPPSTPITIGEPPVVGPLGILGSVLTFEAAGVSDGVETGQFDDDNGDGGGYTYSVDAGGGGEAHLSAGLAIGPVGSVDVALTFANGVPASLDGRSITFSAADGESGTVQGSVNSEGVISDFSGTFTISPHTLPAIVETTGAVTPLLSTPTNVANGRDESDEHIIAFAERQRLVLADDLALEISEPGDAPIGTDPNLSPSTVAAGTVVSSFILHFDVVGSPDAEHTLELQGSVTFDTPILGLILSSDALNATNGVLGAPGTVYANNNQRGLDLVPETGETNDALTLSADRKTLTVDLRNGPNVDDVRVILAVPA